LLHFVTAFLFTIPLLQNNIKKIQFLSRSTYLWFVFYYIFINLI